VVLDIYDISITHIKHLTLFLPQNFKTMVLWVFIFILGLFPTKLYSEIGYIRKYIMKHSIWLTLTEYISVIGRNYRLPNQQDYIPNLLMKCYDSYICSLYSNKLVIV